MTNIIDYNKSSTQQIGHGTDLKPDKSEGISPWTRSSVVYAVRPKSY